MFILNKIFIFLQVGDHNAWSATDGTYYTVCAINDHPNYNADTLEYDYSVLTLCNSLTLSKVSYASHHIYKMYNSIKSKYLN